MVEFSFAMKGFLSFCQSFSDNFTFFASRDIQVLANAAVIGLEVSQQYDLCRDATIRFRGFIHPEHEYEYDD